MDESRLRRLDRRRVLTAGVSFGATFPLVLGYTGIRARRADAPRVIALGAGDDLSVVVTAGPARVLFATGTDTTAFGNALTSAIPFGLRRVDLVLLAGRGRSATVASHAARSLHGTTFAVVDPAFSPEGTDLSDDLRLERLPAPRQYQLPRGVTITVDVATIGEASSWMATIARGRTRVVVVPDGNASELFPMPTPISALVVTSNRPTDAIIATRTPAVVVGAESVSHETLSETVAEASREDLIALRVFPGEAKTLEFVDGGLRLSGDSQIYESPDA